MSFKLNSSGSAWTIGRLQIRAQNSHNFQPDGILADHSRPRHASPAYRRPLPRLQRGLPGTGPDTDPVRYDLTAEAIRLTRLIRALMPEDGEVAGLLALMLLTEARRTARVSASGELVTIDDQDRGGLGRCAGCRGPSAGARAPGRRGGSGSLPDPRGAGGSLKSLGKSLR